MQPRTEDVRKHFKLGECDGLVYDINSAYPYVMLKKRFPDPAKLRIINEDKADEMYFHILCFKENENYMYEGMITCDVCVDENEKLPVLPFRKDSRLIFPCGNFTGSWTFPEIRHALKHGTKITHIHEIVYAPGIESPFKPFVTHYYNERLKTNDLFLKYFFKLLLNNLFGKLLQKSKEEFYFCNNQKEAIAFMKEKKIKKGELLEVQGGFFFKYSNDRIFQHTIACWGSYVTAYVRVMLHESMIPDMKAGKLLYCDTDSKFTERKMKTSDTELGGWKKEKKIIKNVRALKDYVYVDEFGEEKQALKGVKKNAIQLDRYANVFKYNRMIKTRESFRRIDNLPPGTFIDQVKTLTGDYLKREVLKNGETKPFVL